eukprot:403349391
MLPSESYWIRTYFSGAQGNDVLMKRKAKTLSVEQAYKNSDFYRRFSRDLLDHRYPVEFTLNQQKRYEDDQNEERYEIKRIGDEEYLVFSFSLVKIAYAMDETQYFKTIPINFELRPDNLSSFSAVNNIAYGAAASIGMIVVFLGVMWALFPVLRETVFGFKHTQIIKKADEYKK